MSIERTRLEFFNVFRRNLCDLKEAHLAIIVDESTTLDGQGYLANLVWLDNKRRLP